MTLYVGMIRAEPPANGVMQILVRGFNASPVTYHVDPPIGAVLMTQDSDGLSVNLGPLPTPTVSGGPIPPGEWLLLIEQPLPDLLDHQILGLDGSSDVLLHFDELTIPLVGSDGARTALPLWDGLRLYVDPTRFHTARRIGVSLFKRLSKEAA